MAKLEEHEMDTRETEESELDNEDLEKRVTASSTVIIRASEHWKDLERRWEVQPVAAAEDNFTEGGLWAWLTVAGAFLVQYTTFGYTNAFGVYQDYYVRVYLTKYTPSDIGWISGAQIFFIFSSGIFTGVAVDRGYFHHLIIAATILQALALYSLSVAHQNSFYQVFLAQSVCLGLSFGLAYIPSLSIMSHHFRKKRPLAIGIVMSGSALGAVLHPIMLNQLFFGSVGFPNGVRASASLNTFLLIVAILIMRTRPPTKKAEKLPIKEFFVDAAYLSLCAGCILTFFGIFYPIFYLQLNAITHGIDPNLAFYLLSIMNAASIFGRILPPIIAQRLGILNVLVISALAAGAVTCTMSVIHNVVGTTLFAIAYGFCSGSVISMFPSAVALSSRNVNEVGARLGVMYSISGIIGLFASPISGALLTDSLNWTRASLLAGVMLIGGACFGMLARFVAVRKQKSQFV